MKLKIAVGISLIIFWTFIVVIVTLALSRNNQNQVSSVSVNNLKSNELIKLTSEEIAKHDNSNSSWLIIEGKVYDVTQSLSSHPGGANGILPYCGRDGTQAFTTKNKTRPQNHSDTAKSLLVKEILGSLNETINPSKILNVVNNSQTQRQFEDYEDD